MTPSGLWWSTKRHEVEGRPDDQRRGFLSGGRTGGNGEGDLQVLDVLGSDLGKSAVARARATPLQPPRHHPNRALAAMQLVHAQASPRFGRAPRASRRTTAAP